MGSYGPAARVGGTLTLGLRWEAKLVVSMASTRRAGSSMDGRTRSGERVVNGVAGVCVCVDEELGESDGVCGTESEAPGAGCTLMAILFGTSCVGAGVGYAFNGIATSIAGAWLGPVVTTLGLALWLHLREAASAKAMISTLLDEIDFDHAEHERLVAILDEHVPNWRTY